MGSPEADESLSTVGQRAEGFPGESEPPDDMGPPEADEPVSTRSQRATGLPGESGPPDGKGPPEADESLSTGTQRVTGSSGESGKPGDIVLTRPQRAATFPREYGPPGDMGPKVTDEPVSMIHQRPGKYGPFDDIVPLRSVGWQGTQDGCGLLDKPGGYRSARTSAKAAPGQTYQVYFSIPAYMHIFWVVLCFIF